MNGKKMAWRLRLILAFIRMLGLHVEAIEVTANEETD